MALDISFAFLWEATPISDQIRYIDWLVQGLGWTLLVSVSAWCMAVCIGLTIGIMRTLPFKACRLIGQIYVEVFRNIPLLLQLFLWFYVLPELVPSAWGDWLKKDLGASVTWTQYFSEYVMASIALGCYTASRIAEQMRAGIQAISTGQTAAAKALGFGLFQRYRFILLPQAIRTAWLPLTSEALTIFKNSSLAMTIGLMELTGQARQISDYTFRTFEVFFIVTVIYILVSLLVTYAMKKLAERTEKRVLV